MSLKAKNAVQWQNLCVDKALGSISSMDFFSFFETQAHEAQSIFLTLYAAEMTVNF